MDELGEMKKGAYAATLKKVCTERKMTHPEFGCLTMPTMSNVVRHAPASMVWVYLLFAPFNAHCGIVSSCLLLFYSIFSGRTLSN